MRVLPSREQVVRKAIFLSCCCLTGLALADLSRASFWQQTPSSESALRYVYWLFDLAVGFQFLYGSALLVGVSIAFVVSRGRTWKTLGLLAFLFIPFLVSTAALEQAAPARSASALRVVSANVNLENEDPSGLLRWAMQSQADLVVIHEVSPAFAKGLQSATTAFPFQVLKPMEGPFGVAVLSRLPLTSQVWLEPGFLKVTLLHAKETVEVLAAHPVPPLTPEMLFERNHALSTHVDRLSNRSVVVGDLNATPWHPVLRQMEDKGWLRANTLVPTWPSAVPLLGLDHVLATPAWKSVKSELGPAIGSDHRPILVELHRYR